MTIDRLAGAPLRTRYAQIWLSNRTAGLFRWYDKTCRLGTMAPYLILVGLFTLVYLAHPALPGNNIDYPLGWWGWWDQSLYLRSAQALGRLVFSPEDHWYPLGYSLLAAPWTRVVPIHPFFFVNLLCLLGAFFYFVRIGRAVGVRDGVAAIVFIGSIATDKLIFWQFVIPWNTTPVMLYIYVTLAVTLREERLGVPAIVLAAACAALVLVTRPSDMAMLVPIGLALIVQIWRTHPPKLALGRLAAGGVSAGLIIAAFAALHTRIYGFAPSPYMVHSGALGLNFADLPRKLYAVLIDPTPVYGEGQGIFQRAPWMILALPALPFAIMKRSFAVGLLSIVIAINIVFYASYTDFLPHGIWRYNNIHYLKLSYPLIGLLCFYVCINLKDVRRVFAAAIVIIATLSIQYRVTPTSLQARAIDEHTISISTSNRHFDSLILDQGTLDYKNIYFEDNFIRADGLTFRNIYEMRSIPVEGRIYVVFFRPLKAQQIDLTFVAAHGLSSTAPIEVTGNIGGFHLRLPRLP